MKNAAELRRTIGMLRVGDKVEVSLLRDGKPRIVTALIAERSDAGSSGGAGAIHKNLEGAELARCARRRRCSQSVQEGSPAAQAGLRTQRSDRWDRPHADREPQGVQGRGEGRDLVLLNVRRGSQLLLIPVR
jgi:hypothetical protein